jgi:hypothetical protein
MHFSLVIAGYFCILIYCGQSNAPLFCLVLTVGAKSYLLIFSFILVFILYLLKVLIDFFFEKLARSYIAKTLYLLSSTISVITLFVPEIFLYVLNNYFLVFSLFFLFVGSLLILYLFCLKINSEFLDE